MDESLFIIKRVAPNVDSGYKTNMRVRKIKAATPATSQLLAGQIPVPSELPTQAPPYSWALPSADVTVADLMQVVSDVATQKAKLGHLNGAMQRWALIENGYSFQYISSPISRSE